jgi:hypothetical protein
MVSLWHWDYHMTFVDAADARQLLIVWRGPTPGSAFAMRI